MTDREIVVADIGGTHARFAIAEVARGNVVSLGEPTKLATAQYEGLQKAWEAFGQRIGRDLPRAAALAIAAPISAEQIKFTNSHWTLQPNTVANQLGLERHVLLNDFAAIAHAVDQVGSQYLTHVTGPDQPLPDRGVVSVIGPGTGLGIAMLLRTKAGSYVVATEGGHVDFAPLDEVDRRILAHLRQTYDRISVERVVSGPGLRAIHDVLAAMENQAPFEGEDRALWSRALEDRDELASAALDRFCKCLGAVAGDVALTHGPGAVVIAGGLGLRLKDHLPRSGFAERFAAKGRYADLMRSLPVKLITHPEPGLFGAAAAFAKEHL